MGLEPSCWAPAMERRSRGAMEGWGRCCSLAGSERQGESWSASMDQGRAQAWGARMGGWPACLRKKKREEGRASSSRGEHRLG